jgi:hypothetical protein
MHSAPNPKEAAVRRWASARDLQPETVCIMWLPVCMSIDESIATNVSSPDPWHNEAQPMTVNRASLTGAQAATTILLSDKLDQEFPRLAVEQTEFQKRMIT